MTQDDANAGDEEKKTLGISVLYTGSLRRWHFRLAERLRAGGHRIRFDALGTGRPRKRHDIGLLLALEQRLYRAKSILFQPIVTSIAADLGPGDAVDLTIVLAGDPPEAGRWIRPCFDGEPGEGALFAALLDGRSPVITLCDGGDGLESTLAAGHPAIEDRHVLARSLDHVLPRLVTLIVQAVERSKVGSAGAMPLIARPNTGDGAAAGLLMRGVAERVRRLFGPSRGQSCRWRLAYRVASGDDVANPRAWSSSGFTTIETADDGFQADPFPFEHEGRRYVFFEDFRHAMGKGVIARVEIGASGAVSRSHFVLERPFHLSYPVVLAHRGQIYMMPEMSAARRLQLFRAFPFPDRWIEDRVLLDETSVADATPIFHQGRWWLFATITDDGGSSWDQLALFHAPDLFGPWMPHAGNPVLIDAATARPAGAMWHEDGVLMRVAQDCRGGYGRGLAICRVDHLDTRGFAQTVVGQLEPPEAAGASGLHTLNRAGTLETIDLDFA